MVLKNTYSKYTRVVFCAVAIVLGSCKVIQPYQQQKGIAGDKLYRNGAATDSTNIANLSWKQLFNDTSLQALIQEGITNNLDLRVAVARIKAAAANAKQSQQAFLPSLSAGPSVTAQKLAPAQFGNPYLFTLSLNASWQADIWGKLSSAKRATLAALLKSDAYKRAAQTQLVANIATDYYLLLAYDAQLQLTQKTLALRKEEVETMKVLKESDVVTGAAVVQSAANRYSVEVTIPDLQRNIRETENALSVLLGRNPDSIARTALDNQIIATNLKAGVPAQLLANRPDVQQAELQVRNSFELVNVARASFYPALTITASGGWSSANLAQVFDASSIFGNITAGLLQPIFNQGLNKQRLTVANANQEEDLATFKKTVLTAGQEVSDALYSYTSAVDKEALRAQQIGYLQKSVDYTKELLKYSSATNYTDVLTSEQSLLAAQLNSISDKLQKLTAMVALYASLGGGWR